MVAGNGSTDSGAPFATEPTFILGGGGRPDQAPRWPRAANGYCGDSNLVGVAAGDGTAIAEADVRAGTLAKVAVGDGGGGAIAGAVAIALGVAAAETAAPAGALNVPEAAEPGLVVGLAEHAQTMTAPTTTCMLRAVDRGRDEAIARLRIE